MTERGYSDRIEYTKLSAPMLSELNENARQNIENVLLVENGSLYSSLSYSYQDKVARRRLETLNLEDDETYEVMYPTKDGQIFSTILERASLLTQSTLTVDQYTVGNIEEVADLSILRWVEGAEHPFRTNYLLESFKGGRVQATVSHSDITVAQGLDERAMTHYDYAELRKELQLIAMARAGLANAALSQEQS